MSDTRQRRLRDRTGGPATLINAGCKISGLVTASGDVHVSGEIDGDCELEGCVTLAESGYWQGTIRAGHVIIAGRVEGDIVATGQVEITGTARIVGTVSGEAIAVAEGAIVDGIMTTSGRKDPMEFTEKRRGT